jgi:hypothetical protein
MQNVIDFQSFGKKIIILIICVPRGGLTIVTMKLWPLQSPLQNVKKSGLLNFFYGMSQRSFDPSPPLCVQKKSYCFNLNISSKVEFFLQLTHYKYHHHYHYPCHYQYHNYCHWNFHCHYHWHFTIIITFIVTITAIDTVTITVTFIFTVIVTITVSLSPSL